MALACTGLYMEVELRHSPRRPFSQSCAPEAIRRKITFAPPFSWQRQLVQANNPLLSLYIVFGPAFAKWYCKKGNSARKTPARPHQQQDPYTYHQSQQKGKPGEPCVRSRLPKHFKPRNPTRKRVQESQIESHQRTPPAFSLPLRI